jgi:hypothetical protein
VRAAGLASLGYSGDLGDVSLLVAALQDEDPAVRTAARASLAELGGEVAADALAETLPQTDGAERNEVVQALAWLGDQRALEAALEIAEETMFAGPPFRSNRAWQPGAWSAVRLGGEEWREAVLKRIIDLHHSVDHEIPPRDNLLMSAAYNAQQEFRGALWVDYPEESRLLRGRLAAGMQGTTPPLPSAVDTTPEPLLARTIPSLGFGEPVESRPADGSRVAKFGGQPDWREAPEWPTAEGGRPIVFYGQVPLIGQPERTAYIFVDCGPEWEARHGRPLDAGNAVVVQPGPPTHLPTIPLAEGPVLYRPVLSPPRLRRLYKEAPYETFFPLVQNADPPEWDEPGGESRTDWNKIGGTPRYLQSEELPPGEGWKFAFQFGADNVGRELADGAECYGFVDETGRGAFLWQCH